MYACSIDFYRNFIVSNVIFFFILSASTLRCVIRQNEFYIHIFFVIV